MTDADAPPAPAEIEFAVIGGSGFESLDLADRVVLPARDSPWGQVPEIVTGQLRGRGVAFAPRHGAGHGLPPHRVNARALLWGLRRLGAGVLVSTNAVGGLAAALRPGDLVLTDQLIDRTHGRDDTYFDGRSDIAGVQHLPFAEPYDPSLRAAAFAALQEIGERVHPAGTSVVIQGPRFSTAAEAAWHRAMGAQLVNMTQLPEAALAAELGFAHVNLALITDTDTERGSADADTSVTAERVFAVMAAARPRLAAAVSAIIAAVPPGHRASPRLDPVVVDALLRWQG
ncbi:MTAP family purine nucleoside phosphorylase [Microbacterium hydrocarbonoxydans]|uniref:MTAP family purine nucleoside phosphorylase n=1 Tax=Microbacterium hydrocarbonoxydans TaxID=273678 RepID=UPI0007BB96D8|nr:MTAP family purine nucleoside phosphorylase [Microbacterium hydrocarbonoxydans]GAT71623.1 S-methyl-5'-thioadenosine phosphorylase [Microbacterium sp. HM58-2]